jgi:spermidine synthase
MKFNKVTYISDYLINDDNSEIMREWERPIMKKHVDLLNIKFENVLEIGFGMGISASYIQEKKPKKHTIIEINDCVISFANEWSKKYNNVKLIHDDWINIIDTLPKYDCIFFDTYRDDTCKFYKKVDNLLNIGGRFTYFDNENWYGLKTKFNVIRDCGTVVELKQDGTKKEHQYCVPLYIKTKDSNFICNSDTTSPQQTMNHI